MRLAADFDLELFLSEHEKRQAKRDDALREMLHRPQLVPRRLVAAGDGATAPVLLDLGAPAGGLAWAVQQVVCAAQGALTAVAAANVTAAVFVGGVPSNLAAGVDSPGLASAPQTVPFAVPYSPKALIARQGQHLYVVLQGAGTTANGWIATASVLEVLDTSEALTWV
jgi:hypothetical protein